MLRFLISGLGILLFAISSNAQSVIFTDDSNMTLNLINQGDFFPIPIAGLNDPSLNLGISYDLKIDLSSNLVVQAGGSLSNSDVTSSILSTSLKTQTTYPVKTDSLKVVQGIDLDRDAKKIYFIDGNLDDPFLGRICRVDYDGSDLECLVEFEFKSPLSGGGCKLALDIKNQTVYFIRGGFEILKAVITTGEVESLIIPDDTFLADIVLDETNNRLVYLRGTPSTSYFLYQYDLSDPNAEESKIIDIEFQDAKSLFLDEERNQIVIAKQSWVGGAYVVSYGGINLGNLTFLDMFPTSDLVFFNPNGISSFDDLDWDGFTSEVDCNDDDPEINPAAIDIPNNGIDEDCDGMDFISSTSALEQDKITIYPSPVESHIFMDGIPDSASIELIDVEGKQYAKSLENTQIDVSSLMSGIYLLRISHSNKVIHKKFVKF